MGQIPLILPKYMNDKDVRWSLYLTKRIHQETFWSKEIYEQAFFVDAGTIDPSKMRIRHTGVGTKGGPQPTSGEHCQMPSLAANHVRNIVLRAGAQPSAWHLRCAHVQSSNATVCNATSSDEEESGGGAHAD